MADKSGNTGMAFILGVVVVVLAGVVWYIATDGQLPWAEEPEIQIDLPDGS